MNSEKLKTVIIDDEKPGRDNLKAILADYFDDIQVIGEADDLNSSIQLLEKVNPDLVFLDIELGLNTGIELLSLVKNPSFEVVFITAYEDYAAKAFRTIATDYLLKPIDIDELREAILKVKQKIFSKLSQKLMLESATVSNISDNGGNLKISSTDGIEIIPFKDILYLKSINYYTNIILVNGKEIITSKHLKDYEEQLKNNKFFRIHNSYIINTEYLQNIAMKEGFFANLVDGTSIKISRRRKDEFLNFLNS
ncbi:MAG TPA: LytTR family DNA-binding domain-containing protein [Saprospiraceae bacterium]|nr:LytTR family DNA-binding domain-containing protein [Saprospiraceae bacterium]